jgi:hypothetical protein
MTNDEGMDDAVPREFEHAFWNREGSLVVREEADVKRVYDLEERTARIGEMAVIK